MAEKKVKVTLWLDASTAKFFRGMGKGYHARINRILALLCANEDREVHRYGEGDEGEVGIGVGGQATVDCGRSLRDVLWPASRMKAVVHLFMVNNSKRPIPAVNAPCSELRMGALTARASPTLLADAAMGLQSAVRPHCGKKSGRSC